MASPLRYSKPLVKPDETWVIRHAVFGLIESSGDWGHHGDEQLPQLRWRQEFALKETKERHVWAVRQVGAPETEESYGFVLVYVDNMLLLGDRTSQSCVSLAWS